MSQIEPEWKVNRPAVPAVPYHVRGLLWILGAYIAAFAAKFTPRPASIILHATGLCFGFKSLQTLFDKDSGYGHKVTEGDAPLSATSLPSGLERHWQNEIAHSTAKSMPNESRTI